MNHVEFLKDILAILPEAMIETDNSGQIIIYTGKKYSEDNPDMIVDIEDEEE